jgi:hypothetical protein
MMACEEKVYVVDKTWLVRLYEDAGLPPEQAARAAEETHGRLLRRERHQRSEGVQKRSLVEFLVRDPLVSMNRIIGRGDVGLPFYDDQTKRLSLVAFGNVMSDVGIDPVVAMAYAKVVVEAFEPRDLYQPVWAALGRAGVVELEELRRMDWSPLRQDAPAREPARETTATAVTAVLPSAAEKKPVPASAPGPGPAARPPQRRPTQPLPKPKK